MLLKYKPINQFTKSVIGHFLIILIGGIGVGIYGAMLLSLGILYYHFNQKNVISGFLIIILIFVFADNQFNSLGFVKTLRFTSLGVILLFVSSYLLDGKDKISVFFLPFSIYALFTSIFLSPVPMEAIPRSVGFFLVAFIFIDVFRLFFYQRDNLRFFVNVFYWIIFCYYTIGLILFFTPIRDFVSVNGRFAGLMGNPNGVGLLSFLLYPFFDYCRKKKLLTTNEIKYYKVFFSIIFISVVLSGSRNALFSLLIYEITKRYAYNFSRFAIIITLVIAGYLFISNINFPQIIYSLGLENYLRVESLENASGRADIWKVVWEKIKENPWIGKGVYYDQYFVEDYRNNVLGGIYARQWNGVWNSYLSILLDVGIIGLFLYFIFIKKLFSHCQDKVLARAFLLSALFSAIVESWMAASMNIYTPLFFIYFALQSIPLRENLSAYQKKSTVEIPFLYTRLTGYWLSCVNKLHQEIPGSVSVIVRQKRSNEAPFEFKPEMDIKILELDHSLSEIELINFNPDIVYVAGWGNPFYNKLAKKYRDQNIPVVCGMDNHWLGTLRQRIGCFLAPLIIHNKFSHIWVPGLLQYSFAQRLGFKTNQILKNLYVADSNSTVTSPVFQKRFLFFGRLVDHKGVDVLLKAYSDLRESGCDWNLEFIGNGPFEDQIKASEGCTIRPFMQPDKLREELKKGGVFILPSKYEAWGVAIQEAALSGMPIIGTHESGATTQFLINGYNGFKIHGSDANNLFKAMKKISCLKDNELNLMAQRSLSLGKTITPELWVNELLSVIK